MDSWVIQVVQSLGYAGVGLLMLLENIFPPIPSELIMPLAGFAAAQGKLNIWLAILIGALGTLLGTLPWYGAARWLRNDRVYAWVERHGHWLTVDPDELARAERWFARHGRWIVAAGRLVPGVRTLISVPAGFCGMPLARYLAYSAVGTALWTGMLAYLGHLLGEHYAEVARYLGPVTWAVLGALLAIYLYRLVRMRRRSHRRRAREHSHQA